VRLPFFTSGLVDHQHRTGITQVVNDVVPQVLGDAVGVPSGPAEQVLHAIGGGIPSVLGDRPAVLARQVGQQRQQEPADPPPALAAAEAAGDPIQQLIDPGPPGGRPYPGPRDHRGAV
jgi:hypothetical protein